ncbi:MAG: hypothetical protein M4579_004435 [Chaenotheca gracillima]|nr:MAG: hypothetical protein M4579_004435 [Chaenotheca gracillima]
MLRHLQIVLLAFLASLLVCNAQQNSQSAQLLDFTPGALPICANGCQPLQAAQGACVPPAVPASNTATYQSCFCHSAFLQTLFTSPNGVCDSACPGPNDLAQVRTWFLSKCRSSASATAGPSTASVLPAPTSPTTTDSSSPTVVGSAATQTAASKGPPKSWWSTHWKWVLMLIIIFLGIILVAIAGVLLKRYLKRRKTAAAMAAIEAHGVSITSLSAPVAMGPHQHQHFSHGFSGYGGGDENPQQPMAARGKGKSPMMSGGATPAILGKGSRKHPRVRVKNVEDGNT